MMLLNITLKDVIRKFHSISTNIVNKNKEKKNLRKTFNQEHISLKEVIDEGTENLKLIQMLRLMIIHQMWLQKMQKKLLG